MADDNAEPSGAPVDSVFAAGLWRRRPPVHSAESVRPNLAHFAIIFSCSCCGHAPAPDTEDIGQKTVMLRKKYGVGNFVDAGASALVFGRGTFVPRGCRTHHWPQEIVLPIESKTRQNGKTPKRHTSHRSP